jgi:hypothetical protein
MILLLAAALPGHAATFTAEDLVRAHARGLTTETTVRMAESIGTDADTAVYLLRRGVPPETVRAWGYAVADAEGIAAMRLGTLAAPVAGVSDTDWSEMTELPVGLERGEGTRVAGKVVELEPARVVLRTSADVLTVERPEVRDVWVDARPIDRAVRDSLLDADAPRRGLPSHVVHQRRGNTGVAFGSILAIAGTMTLLGGAMGPDLPTNSWGGGGYSWGRRDYGGALSLSTVGEPNPLMMAAGAVGVLAGSVTFHFGARQLRLAASDRGAWVDETAL